MIPSLFDKISHHIEQYQQQSAKESSIFWGGTGWFASKAPFEKETLSLANEISREIQSLDDTSLVHHEMTDMVRQLFFEIVPEACSKQTQEEIRSMLSDNKALQNLLDPDVAKGRIAKTADESLKFDPDARLARRIAKAKLAHKLGYKGEYTGQGQGGARFLTGINRKRLGVFKTTLAHQSHWKNLHDGPLSYVMYNQAYYVDTEGVAPAQAEEAAYIVATRIGFGDLVPPTQVMKLGDVAGSFQLMAKKEPDLLMSDFSKIAVDFENREKYTDDEIQMFQIFAVFDYLINNLDRHNRNWLVQYTNEGGNVQLRKIHAIDHDRSFVHTTPDSYRGLRNHYKWRNLKIAKEPMTRQTKEFILQYLTDDGLASALTFEHKRMGGFLTPEKVLRIADKVRVLQLAAEREGINFEQIGNIRTADEIARFLSAPDDAELS